MKLSDPDKPQAGYRCKWKMPRVIKANSDHQRVIKCAEYDGIHPRGDGNEHIIRTNVLSQGNWSGAHSQE